MLNKQKGNMYPFVTHTWNVIKGKCPYDCEYCYMKVFPQKDIQFHCKEMLTDLGENNFIFVGSSCDMFADGIKKSWIKDILAKCRLYDNTYLFQTKNPERFLEFIDLFPEKTIFGTTLETNREVGLRYSKAPPIISRMSAMRKIKGRKMITIEPIFDFDVIRFIEDLQMIKPEWINIGADSKGHNLPEPSKEKIQELIDSCRCFTEVKIKDNLVRLMK